MNLFIAKIDQICCVFLGHPVSYLVGCHALGLINKFVTGPLWRVMEQQHHILDMNKYFQRLLKHFELWAEDATSFLTEGRDLFGGEFIHDDGFLRALLQGGSDGVEFWDDLTKQCLELIFWGILCCNKTVIV